MPKKKKILRTAVAEIKGNLYDIAAMGDVTQLQLLLDHGRRVIEGDDHQSTALHYACRNGKAQSAQFLIQNGADIHAKTDAGITPLMCAATNNHAPIVNDLLDAGKSSLSEMLLAESDQELTAMDYAVAQRHYGIATTMARQMRCLSSTFQPPKDIFEAVEHDDLTYIKCQLLLKKISPNITDEQGRTVLMQACTLPFARSGKLIRYLLKFYSTELQLNVWDQDHNTALLLAIKNGNTQQSVTVVQALVETGKVDCNHEDSQGMTAFLWAVALELRPVLSLLLDYYDTTLNVRHVDHLGRTWESIVANSQAPAHAVEYKKFILARLPRKTSKATAASAPTSPTDE